MKIEKTISDYGLFNNEKYTYREVKVYKDNDPRISRKDSYYIKQINERLHLTELQMKQLRDILNQMFEV